MEASADGVPFSSPGQGMVSALTLQAVFLLRGPTWFYRTNMFAPGYSPSLKANCLHLRDGVPWEVVLS